MELGFKVNHWVGEGSKGLGCIEECLERQVTIGRAKMGSSPGSVTGTLGMGF